MSIFEHSSALGYGIFEKYIFLWNPCTFNSIELKDNSANGSVTFNIYIYIYLFLKKTKCSLLWIFYVAFSWKIILIEVCFNEKNFVQYFERVLKQN